MAKSTKDIKVTIDYDTLHSCIAYSQLYLENRIMQLKAAGKDYINYQQELDEINQFVKRL